MTSPLGEFFQSLTGGFAAGSQFRQQRDDRKRVLANESEDRDYQRARRLREQVGFELDQRTQQATLDRGEVQQGLSDERRQQVRTAAVNIRTQFKDDPRFRPLLVLPDEELVTRVGEMLSHQDRSRRERSLETRQDLGTVERQVDDTRADLSRAEREMPTRPLLAQSDPTGPAGQQFVADSTAAGGRVDALRQRADSLGMVRDSIAAEVQGRTFRRPPPQPVAPAPDPVARPIRARPPAARPAPDELLVRLGQQFGWDEAKIRSELIRLGYDAQ